MAAASRARRLGWSVAKIRHRRALKRWVSFRNPVFYAGLANGNADWRQDHDNQTPDRDERYVRIGGCYQGVATGVILGQLVMPSVQRMLTVDLVGDRAFWSEPTIDVIGCN